MPRHEHSARARQQGDYRAGTRSAAILEVLRAEGGLTDREVLQRLIARGTLPQGADINAVRPRITEMVKAHVLRESGDKKDPLTGMLVRKCDLGGSLF